MLAELIPIPECVYMVCVAIYALQEGHAKRGGGGGGGGYGMWLHDTVP